MSEPHTTVFFWGGLSPNPSRHSVTRRNKRFSHFFCLTRDRIADQIRAKLKLSQEQLTLAQVLESATWKGGREIAKERRPESGGPPIEIVSDGTVF